MRVEAVKSLVDIRTQHSLEPLLKATNDNDPEVQIRAAEGLVNFYYPGYIKTGWTASMRRVGSRLVNRFGGETNDQIVDAFVRVRPEVIQALGRLARGGSSMDSRAASAATSIHSSGRTHCRYSRSGFCYRDIRCSAC